MDAVVEAFKNFRWQNFPLRLDGARKMHQYHELHLVC
jgi:hypothetical protein